MAVPKNINDSSFTDAPVELTPHKDIKHHFFLDDIYDGKYGLTKDGKKPTTQRDILQSVLDKFNIHLSLPECERGVLVPTVTLRLNYLAHIAEWIEPRCLVLARKCLEAEGIDVGCGYSAIFSLLSAHVFNWKCDGYDCNKEAVEFAIKNVASNSGDDKGIDIKHASSLKDVLQQRTPNERYSFLVCNPPFFDDTTDNQRQYPFTEEYRTEGGESAFIRDQIIIPSFLFPKSVHLYTTMIGKRSSVEPVMKALRCVESRLFPCRVALSTLCQGRVTRWLVAWTHATSSHLPRIIFEDVDKPQTIPRNRLAHFVTPFSFSLPVSSFSSPLEAEGAISKCLRHFRFFFRSCNPKENVVCVSEWKQFPMPHVPLPSFDNPAVFFTCCSSETEPTWTMTRRKRRALKTTALKDTTSSDGFSGGDIPDTIMGVTLCCDILFEWGKRKFYFWSENRLQCHEFMLAFRNQMTSLLSADEPHPSVPVVPSAKHSQQN